MDNTDTNDLLEKTRLPHPSLQKLAVISIFRSTSQSNNHAITRCLHSTSSVVVDQSVREFCGLVRDSKLDVSTALLELHSALENTTLGLRTLFVKAIGFVVRIAFLRDCNAFRFPVSHFHPFVKVLCCGAEVEGELLKQVVLFIGKCKHLGMELVCDFLGPFLNYSIIKHPASVPYSVFTNNLMSTMTAVCCSFPAEAIPIIKLLTGRLKYFICKNAEEVTNASYVMECMVNAYLVVLRQLVGMGLHVCEAQLCGVALLEAILSRHSDFRKCSGGVEKILDVSRYLLAVQKELGLHYVTEISSLTLRLFPILIQSELEHEQYPVLKLVLFLLGWKNETGNDHAAISEPREELLFIFPVLAFVSSPSRSIKQTAIDVLSVLGKIATTILIAPTRTQVGEDMHVSISTPGHIVLKCLRNIWFEEKMSPPGLFYLMTYPYSEVYVNEKKGKLKSWASSVREYYLRTVEKQKSKASISHSTEIFLTDMPLIISAISSVSLLHQKGNSVIDLLAMGSKLDPKLCVPLLLIVLFYNNLFSNANKEKDFHDKLLKLLSLLPSIASQTAMIPLVLQVLQPMLHKDVNHVIKATAIRLICKTWEINDRTFRSLQELLHPSGLVQFASERVVCISIAVSIQDVCRRNPDRGVDIILSVAACIENNDPLVQSLGLQSLAHLCEADVIDFYTAWEVISKNVQNYLANASIAHGLCCLLRWGAMDAEAYLEASTNVLNILWDIGKYKDNSHSLLWTRAREAAFSALLQYEVVHIQRTIPEFSSRNLELIISLGDLETLTAIEEFEVKVINYEHISRRRFVKQRRVPKSKIIKLLDVVPDVIFNSGHNRSVRELPGAALLSIPTHKNLKSLKSLKEVHAKFEDAAMEISASLQLSRNVLLALLSLQSWKPFMQRWMRSCIMVLEAKAHPTMLDKTSKAANDILKIITRLAETAIPRSAENIVLSLGAFCLVLPASAHSIKSMASEFLLIWLSQYEHEYRQWSAAISLGLISSCLHMTDHKQKLENINALIEVASYSKSILVKGACGIGLGFACQDLLTRVNSNPNTQFEKEPNKTHETELLKKILRTLVQMTCQFTGSSSGILEKLSAYFPIETDNISSFKNLDINHENINYPDEDAWGYAGPIIGLSYSLGALYRAGAHDAILYLKDLIISWIPNNETYSQMSSLGACIALPNIVSFCQKVEMIDDIELDRVVNGLMCLITNLLTVDQSDTFHQSLLIACCAGAGSVFSTVYEAGLESLKTECVKGFLTSCRRTYSSLNPPLVHLGGMLGVVNAMGAGAGTMVQITTFDKKESSFNLGPLLSNQVLEAESTSLIQEMFLVAQNPEDPQLQHYAAWSISFLRHYFFSRAPSNEESPVLAYNDSESASQIFPEDSLIMKLSSWLMQINYLELGTRINIRTVAFALRCLSHAPKLPSLDWGAVARRCMKYGGQVDLPTKKGALREECFLFSLSHANQFDSLLGFLDELLDIARFKTLELDLQSAILLHMEDMLKIFSNSRIVKFFDDVANFLHWLISSDKYNEEQKISLRVSCWKGLNNCVTESGVETQDYACNLESCIGVLFQLLPCQLSVAEESYQRHCSMEWSEAIKCLGKSRKSWITDFLLVSNASFKEVNQKPETLKKLQAIAALVRIGTVPLSELTKLRAYILDTNTEIIWNILVEVTVTLQQSDESVRRQWLVDTVEILCVTRYPSTALRFLGLLSGSCCNYMPLLVIDKLSVLSDLPVTLSSLLVSSGWETVAESIASYLCKSTERIHDWVNHTDRGDYLHGSQPIDPIEKDIVDFLLKVLRETCVVLKDYLPVEKQLQLANMFLT